MAKKKLTPKQKAINRIQRRLKTLERNGNATKIKPTKKNIEEILKNNKIKVTDKNINQVVNDTVKATTYHINDARKVKQILNKKTVADVRALTGAQLHDIIADLYDNNLDTEADEILDAYGY